MTQREYTLVTDKARDATATQMQQLLERQYPQLEWRVLINPGALVDEADEPWLFVHARTRDFCYRCRVGRPWSRVTAAPALSLLVAELAAEAEQLLADQGAAAP